MASSNDIRATFVDFFARNDHQVVPSSSLVPVNDPTLPGRKDDPIRVQRLHRSAYGPVASITISTT